MRAIIPVAIAVVSLVAVGSVFATENEQTGRYTMSPAEGGGFVRLDTQTGTMSLCDKKNGAWSCRAMTNLAGKQKEELEQLRSENERLKDEINRMENSLGLNDNGPPAPVPPKLKLPTEQDVDKAIDYLEGIVKKLRERFDDFGDKTDPDSKKNNSNPATPL